MPAPPPDADRLRALLRNVADTITIFDAEGTVVWTGGNPGGTLGRDDDEWPGQDGLAQIHPEDRLHMAAKLAELLTEPGKEVTSDYRVKTFEGDYVFCEGTAVNLLDDPLVQGIVLTSRNITERKRTEVFLRWQTRILEGIATGVLLEQTLADVGHLVQESMPGSFPTVALDVDNAAAVAAVDDPWCRPLVGVTTAANLGVLVVGVDGDRLPTEHESVVLDTAGHLAAIAIERSRAEDRLARLALHDPLTGLPNRVLLRDRLDTALRRMARHQLSVAVLFLDLDRFKVVNDSLGHGAGDELLLALSSRLQAILRPGDTVARFGGDEFVVICEEIVDEVHARTLADRLERVLDDPFHIGGGDVVLTASVGIAITSSVDDDPDRLLRDADAAMYQAKEAGRGRIAVFDATMRARAVARLQLEGDLRQGLARGELVVHYQPIHDVVHDRIVAVEALARWRHPQRELLLPLDFLELAEETGLVIPLEQEVLDRALAEAAQWLDLGVDLCVNASPVHVADLDYAARVQAALEKSGWPPDRLVLELTERVLLDDDHHVLATLGRLRSLGVRLVVDDFGTGYSSLGYLHRFPVDGVKVDRSFIERLGTGDRDEAVVKAIFGMAEALGLDVVAEGVETGKQLQILRRLGCQRAQGYLLGPPVAPEDLRLDR